MWGEPSQAEKQGVENQFRNGPLRSQLRRTDLGDIGRDKAKKAEA